MIRTLAKLAAVGVVYLIGYGRGMSYGTTVVRDSWQRTVRRDANATMDARASAKR